MESELTSGRESDLLLQWSSSESLLLSLSPEVRLELKLGLELEFGAGG
jgi:hypothetical protein